MENQRFFLIFAVACSGFLLWQAWQADYGRHEPKAGDPVVTAAPASTTPAVPVIASELPVVEAPKNNETPITASAPTSNTASQIIAIHTDTLLLLVNLQGGDIVDARLAQYPTSLNTLHTPFRLLGNTDDLEYVAQSGLLSEIGPDLPSGQRLPFKATQLSYSLLPHQEKLLVPLTWQNDAGMVITKTFTLKRGSYDIDVDYAVVNHSTQSWSGRFYAQLKRKHAAESRSFLSGGAYSFTGAAYSTPEAPYKKIAFSDMESEPLKQTVEKGWIAMIQHYFVSSWIPRNKSLFYGNVLGDSTYRIGFSGETLTVPASGTAHTGATLYVGPKIQAILKQVAPKLELTIDYGWLWFIAQPLFWLLQWFYQLVLNWGAAIILITVCVKAAFFQLSTTSYRSMANMRRIQPQMVALKERFAEDRTGLSQAMMALYKKEKINPFGGCLPILVQIPVFIALYWVLLESVELRQAGFIFWIHDLSEKDPYYVLPILMGVTMMAQQSLNPAPPDPMQARIMKIMPIIFTFFFLFFPAGLVLYWFVSNLLSITQQWVITRMIAK